MFKHRGLASFVVVFLLFVSLVSFLPIVSGDPGIPVTNERNEIDTWVVNPCTEPPEPVHLTGTEHLVTRVVMDETGAKGFFHINQSLQGVGENTGTPYQYASVFNQSGHADEENKFIVVNAQQHVISLGSAPNFALHFRYRFVLRDGELVREETVMTTDCQG